MKTITFELSPKSVNKAIKELEKYQNGLMGKLDMLMEQLADIGIKEIRQNDSPPGDSAPGQAYSMVSISNDVARVDIIYEGTQVLFIEFGAGVHYNGQAGGSPHPRGAEFGYTIGSYGKGYGANDFWQYVDNSGNMVISHGTQAGMPVYKASQKLRQELVTIAQGVFGG